MQHFQRLVCLGWLSGFLILFPLGCGSRRPETAPVSGTVTLDGQPVTDGIIRFFPEKGAPATGKIGSDGRYTLSTFDQGDGAVLGSHRITITRRAPGGQPSSAGGAPGEPAPGLPSGQPLLPARYSQPQTTPLETEVVGKTDTMDFALTSSP